MTINYVGYPRFPVTIELLGTNCPAAFDCTKQTKTYTVSTTSPLTASFTCKTTTTTTATTKFLVDVQLIDVDGIKTVIQRPQVTCVKPV